MNISMALVDYIPVILFLISSIMLQRTLYDRFSKGAFALFAGGTIMVIVAGAFKATWKLLYAAGICDFQKLSQVFFPMPTVIISTLCEDGTTTLGPYSLVQPYYVAGKEFYAMLLSCRNSSNTA